MVRSHRVHRQSQSHSWGASEWRNGLYHSLLPGRAADVLLPPEAPRQRFLLGWMLWSPFPSPVWPLCVGSQRETLLPPPPLLPPLPWVFADRKKPKTTNKQNKNHKTQQKGNQRPSLGVPDNGWDEAGWRADLRSSFLSEPLGPAGRQVMLSEASGCPFPLL